MIHASEERQTIQSKIDPRFNGTRVKVGEDFFVKPFSNSELENVYYRLTASKNGENLITESPSFDDVDDFYNPGESMILEAITVSAYSQTDKRMAAFVRVMNKFLNGNEDGIEAQTAIIGTPKKAGLFAYVTVQIPFSDGQSISMVFHSPEGDKKKIGPDDSLIAFRWLLNKRDITHVVAPEDGKDVSLESIGKRITQLLSKNHARFVKTQKEAAEESKRLEEISAEVSTLEEANTELATVITTLEDNEKSVVTNIATTESRISKQQTRNAELEAEITSLRAKKMAKSVGGDSEGNGQDPTPKSKDGGKGETVDIKNAIQFFIEKVLGGSKNGVLVYAEGNNGIIETKVVPSGAKAGVTKTQNALLAKHGQEPGASVRVLYPPSSATKAREYLEDLGYTVVDSFNATDYVPKAVLDFLKEGTFYDIPRDDGEGVFTSYEFKGYESGNPYSENPVVNAKFYSVAGSTVRYRSVEDIEKDIKSGRITVTTDMDEPENVVGVYVNSKGRAVFNITKRRMAGKDYYGYKTDNSSGDFSSSKDAISYFNNVVKDSPSIKHSSGMTIEDVADAMATTDIDSVVERETIQTYPGSDFTKLIASQFGGGRNQFLPDAINRYNAEMKAKGSTQIAESFIKGDEGVWVKITEIQGQPGTSEGYANATGNDQSTSKVLDIMKTADGQAEIHITQSTYDNKFNVSFKDVDSGEMFGVSKRFQDETPARDYAKAELEKYDKANPAEQETADDPKRLDPFWNPAKLPGEIRTALNQVQVRPVIGDAGSKMPAEFRKDGKPAGYLIMNAARPLMGDSDKMWNGDFNKGRFYVAIDPNGEFSKQNIESNRKLDGWLLAYVSIEDAREWVSKQTYGEEYLYALETKSLKGDQLDQFVRDTFWDGLNGLTYPEFLEKFNSSTAISDGEDANTGEPAKSTGHIAFSNGNEYYTVPNGDIHKAPIENPVMTDGRRSGRFESTGAAKDALLKMLGISNQEEDSTEESGNIVQGIQIVTNVAGELGGTLSAWEPAPEGVLGRWEYATLAIGDQTLRIGVSGGGVVNIDGDPFDPDRKMNLDEETVKRSILAKIEPVKKVYDPTTEYGYSVIMNSEELKLEHQDTLDSFFQERYVAVRNALRDLGWEGEQGKDISKNGYTLNPLFKYVGAGRNVVGINYEISGVPGFFMSDTLSNSVDELAKKIDMGLPQATDTGSDAGTKDITMPTFRDWRVSSYPASNSAIIVPNKVGGKFSDDDLNALVAWAKENGWSTIEKKPTSIKIIGGMDENFVKMGMDDYGYSGVKDEVRSENAIKKEKEEFERKAAESEKYKSMPSSSWIDKEFSDAELNDYNKLALAKFLDGESPKFNGAISWKWAETLKRLGAITDDERVDWDKLKSAYNSSDKATDAASGDMPSWAKEKLDKIMAGESVVVGDDWLDMMAGKDEMDNIVTIPNPKRLGTKDVYLAGLATNPEIKAYRVEKGIETPDDNEPQEDIEVLRILDELDSIVTGNYQGQPDEIDRILDEVADELEKRGLLEKYEDQLNAAADVLTKELNEMAKGI